MGESLQLVSFTLHVYVHGDEVLSALASLHEQGAQLMALSTAVQAKVDSIKAALDAGVAGITSDIQALKDKITAGGASDAEILAGLDQIGQSAQKVTDLDLANPGGIAPPDQV